MDLNSVPNPDEFTDGYQSEADKQLYVRFYVRPMEDRDASTKAGRAVFRDVEFIDIRVPGSRDNIARPATQRDIQRFSEHYKRFKDRVEAPLEGTPLAEWPLATRSLVEQLSFLGVKTVEQLANMADVHTGSMMGLGSLKRRAQDWLEDSKDDAPLSALSAKLEETESALKQRDKTIDALMQRLTALEEAQANQKADSPPAAGDPAPAPAPEEALASEALDGAAAPPPDPATPRGRRRLRRAVKKTPEVEES